MVAARPVVGHQEIGRLDLNGCRDSNESCSAWLCLS
jgi:hypothetical protein